MKDLLYYKVKNCASRFLTYLCLVPNQMSESALAHTATVTKLYQSLLHRKCAEVRLCDSLSSIWVFLIVNYPDIATFSSTTANLLSTLMPWIDWILQESYYIFWEKIIQCMKNRERLDWTLKGTIPWANCPPYLFKRNW